MFIKKIFLFLTCLVFQLQAQNITVNHIDGYDCELIFHAKKMRCSLGQNGITSFKQEGDGCTPVGSFKLRESFYRADRIEEPHFPSWFNRTVTLPNFGWCDDPASDFYNRFIFLPTNYSHEELWLNSSVYDLLAVVGYNDNPVVPNGGSAIFFHVTETYGPTAGCVALSLIDLKWVLSRINESTFMVIQ